MDERAEYNPNRMAQEILKSAGEALVFWRERRKFSQVISRVPVLHLLRVPVTSLPLLPSVSVPTQIPVCGNILR